MIKNALSSINIYKIISTTKMKHISITLISATLAYII